MRLVIHLGTTVTSSYLMLWFVFYLIIVDSPVLRGITVGPRDYMLCLWLAGAIVFTDVLPRNPIYVRSFTHECA